MKFVYFWCVRYVFCILYYSCTVVSFCDLIHSLHTCKAVIWLIPPFLAWKNMHIGMYVFSVSEEERVYLLFFVPRFRASKETLHPIRLSVCSSVRLSQKLNSFEWEEIGLSYQNCVLPVTRPFYKNTLWFFTPWLWPWSLTCVCVWSVIHVKPF